MPELIIFETIEFIAALIRSEERKRCAELRIQLVQFEVLEYLSHSNQYNDTPAATADFFGMTRGTVSQSLIVLEKKGYLEKNKDANDKRIIHVNLLPAGQAILKKARKNELFNKANSQLKKNTTSTDLFSIFVDLLNAMQSATQSQSFKVDQNTKLVNSNKTSLIEIINHIATIIRSEQRKKCTDLKLQLVHFQILEYLSLCNKYSDTPAAISKYLGMTRGTISQSLILLEKSMFIEKTQDSVDKRIFHIHLLNKGIDTLKKAKLTPLFTKVALILEKKHRITANEHLFIEALRALQKANNSSAFSICKSCKNFTEKSTGFFCNLTQENLTDSDSQKICQEHIIA